jgi:transposase
MSNDTLSKFVLLPEILSWNVKHHGDQIYYWCVKDPKIEYCPKCAAPSSSGYDTRHVAIKDAPIRDHGVTLYIRKRRLWCKPCGRPFTEPVPGIRKGKRHTERYANSVGWACDKFADLKSVRRAYKCSAHFVYHAHYSRLEREIKEKINYPWTSSVGIDEHSFRKDPLTRRMEFASLIVDYDKGRVREIVLGKTCEELKSQLALIPGRENVRQAVIDMCDPFKNFIREFFPNALITADKFHVLRLLSPALLRRRKEITGTRADARAKRLLLMGARNLDYSSALTLRRFLEHYPELHELYVWKERLHGFYRMRGHRRAQRAFTAMTDEMALSQLPEIKTLRKTLLKWRVEVLNYFLTRLTNGRTEGFNNKAKVVKRRAYGYRSFRNYRLKVLTACV